MINHARTLLLNVTAPTGEWTTYLGDEVIDPTFHAINYPTYIDTVRTYLFGSQPDRYMLNYRLMQYLNLLHASPLATYLRRLDSRITYELNRNTYVDPHLFRPQVSRLAGAEGDRLTVIGAPQAPDQTGRMYHSFTVDILNTGSIQVSRSTGRFQNVVFDLAVNDGVSDQFLLHGAGYKFYVNTTNVGALWRVDAYNRPQWDLGQIAANLATIGEPTLVQLFGTENAEPWNTFRRLWYEHRELPLKLGGLLMALIYRSEEHRAGG